MLDINAILSRLTAACNHYEKTAPTVHAYCDDLFQRIEGDPDSVRLTEIRFVERLCEEGQWTSPNLAANVVLHLMDRLGMVTAGHAGF